MTRLLTAAALIAGALFAAATPAHAATLTSTTIAYGTLPNATMTVYRMDISTSDVAVLFVHGGAWARATATVDEISLAKSLAQTTGWAVGVVNYPTTTSPHYTLQPASVNTARQRLTAWPGVNPAHVALWGESAGAHLALLVAYRHPGEVAAVASISGPTDMTTEYAVPAETTYVNYFEEGSPAQVPDRYASTSPINAVTPASTPTFQAASIDDPHVPHSQMDELTASLTAAGVEHTEATVTGLDHATPIEYQKPPGSTRTIAGLAADFIKAHLGGSR